MHKYQVIVGNIGTVCDTDILESAEEIFAHYKKQSESGVGRAAEESITLFEDGEIHTEHIGSMDMGHCIRGYKRLEKVMSDEITLEQIALRRAKTSLRPEVFAIQPDTAFETGIGILIAEHLENHFYDEDAMLRIAAHAFEHTNHHDKAAEVRRLMRGTLPNTV